LRRELGDFQTPSALVTQILQFLGPIGERWPRVLEPTCGNGQFIQGVLTQRSLPREIQAIEIQQSHWQAAQVLIAATGAADVHVELTCADVFSIDLARDLRWSTPGPLLVIGNPPWVTNSELGRLASPHRPPRRNVKDLPGLEARTGSANFDVAEAVWLKLIFELADQAPTIALLCKTSVARNVVQFLRRGSLPIASASIRRIDAARWFHAAVDACLFCVTIGRSDPGLRVPVFGSLDAERPETIMGIVGGKLVADCDAHAHWSFADGTCPLTWRQGLKHDAAAVMELHRPGRTREGEPPGEPRSVQAGPGPRPPTIGAGRHSRDRDTSHWRNKDNEIVDVESEFVYPLVKGADLTRPPGSAIERAVVVTQQRIGQDTTSLAHEAPRLWRYLAAHEAWFKKRRSSIYRGQPPFAIFGIGPYSFAPFKLAIAGFHRSPVFRVLGPAQGRPVMLDDTCYFLPCSTAEEAAVLGAICNDPIALGLIATITLREAKRPVTKALLQRLDLAAIVERADRRSLLDRALVLLRDELRTQPSERLEEIVTCAVGRFSRNASYLDGPSPKGAM
jgi:hypothetical protein